MLISRPVFAYRTLSAGVDRAPLDTCVICARHNHNSFTIIIASIVVFVFILLASFVCALQFFPSLAHAKQTFVMCVWAFLRIQNVFVFFFFYKRANIRKPSRRWATNNTVNRCSLKEKSFWHTQSISHHTTKWGNEEKSMPARHRLSRAYTHSAHSQTTVVCVCWIQSNAYYKSTKSIVSNMPSAMFQFCPPNN